MLSTAWYAIVFWLIGISALASISLYAWSHLRPTASAGLRRASSWALATVLVAGFAYVGIGVWIGSQSLPR
jgi:hypothetical protein